jgi:single-strand DNA-binding protein
MNQVIETGRLTRDPEIKTFGSGDKQSTVVNFDIAVSRKYRKADGSLGEEVNFFPCEAWDSGAEAIAKHFSKGDPILVFGSLRNETWDDKDSGKKRVKTKIRVERFEFFEGRRKSANDEAGSSEGEAVGVGAGAEGGVEDPATNLF